MGDRRFLLALLAGPLAWLALAMAGWLPARTDLVFLLMAILVRPVVEELVFRGLVQGELRKHLTWQWRGLTLANAIASIAFAALHFVYQPPAWAVAVFVPSLVFGYFRDRHESVLPSIILHTWYNAGFFLLPFVFG